MTVRMEIQVEGESWTVNDHPAIFAGVVEAFRANPAYNLEEDGFKGPQKLRLLVSSDDNSFRNYIAFASSFIDLLEQVGARMKLLNWEDNQ